MLSLILLTSLALGGTTTVQPDLDSVVLPRKTEIFVSLERNIDSRNATVGDRFHGRLTVPITHQDRIVVPVGSYVIGSVDHTKKPGYLRGKAQVALSFDTIILPNGVTRRMVASTQSAEGHSSGAGHDEGKIIASSSQSDEVITTTAGTAAAGGAVGAIAGRGLKGFGIGAAVGAATGVILGLIVKGKHVTLPRGASLTIQLDEDVSFIRPDELQRGKPLKP